MLLQCPQFRPDVLCSPRLSRLLFLKAPTHFPLLFFLGTASCYQVDMNTVFSGASTQQMCSSPLSLVSSQNCSNFTISPVVFLQIRIWQLTSLSWDLLLAPCRHPHQCPAHTISLYNRFKGLKINSFRALQVRLLLWFGLFFFLI